MDLKYIKFKQKDGIGWVQFNRPERLNALNPDVLRDLEAAVGCCEEDDAIRVVVLKGNDKAFVSGADIEDMAKGDIKFAYRLTDLTMRVQERLADLPKPTIAAISGYALGGGLEVALCCDFRIAADNAVLGSPEITLGIIPGAGCTQRLPRLVNLGVATRIILLGDMIKPEEAERIGLINRVVPHEELEQAVTDLARNLSQKSPAVMRLGRDSYFTMLDMDFDKALEYLLDVLALIMTTEDHKEGLAAFQEKRKPIWKNR